MPTSIDIAGIGVKLNDQFSFFAGKQCAAYGGIEFDLNPIEIYEYSDMIENMSNFMTGLNNSNSKFWIAVTVLRMKHTVPDLKKAVPHSCTR